jgi:hypothetical protein
MYESANERRQAYYCSREWGLKREAVHRRSGGICERCKRNPGAAVHHLTYARLFNEPLEDLWHLCHECHDFIHGRGDVDPIKITKSERLKKLFADIVRLIEGTNFHLIADEAGINLPAAVREVINNWWKYPKLWDDIESDRRVESLIRKYHDVLYKEPSEWLVEAAALDSSCGVSTLESDLPVLDEREEAS